MIYLDNAATTPPLEKAVDMVMNGEIPDGKTQTLILRVAEMKRRGIIGGGRV